MPHRGLDVFFSSTFATVFNSPLHLFEVYCPAGAKIFFTLAETSNQFALNILILLVNALDLLTWNMTLRDQHFI